MLKRSYAVPRDRMITDIGYKCNMRKVCSWITTEYSGITKDYIPYFSQYLDLFANVSINPVDHTLVMSKLFVSVYEVDFNNKYMQSNLVTEKWLVTLCGCLWLWNTVFMRTTIPNCYKLYHYGFKRYQYEKLIGFREFLN